MGATLLGVNAGNGASCAEAMAGAVTRQPVGGGVVTNRGMA